MTGEAFRYRPVLEQLTTVAREEGLDPYEAYAWLCEQQAGLELNPEAYLSTSITSGGHARDSDLGIGEVISRNRVSQITGRATRGR